jgi:hypothetical protein
MQTRTTDSRLPLNSHTACLTVAITLLGLCITSCATRQAGPLSAHVRQEMVRPPGDENKFVRHGVSRLVFMIENDTNDVIVLRDCTIPGQLPDIDRWHGARYGSVDHRPLEDVWRYSEMAQQLSMPVFAMGIIPPAGNLKVTRWAILREDHVALEIAYHRLTPAQARQHLYVETARDTMIMDRVFKHPQELPGPSDEGLQVNWRVVIFPEAETLDIHSQTLTRPVSLREPPVGMETIQTLVAGPIRDSVYCRRQQAWAVKTPQAMYLLAGRERIALPEMDILAFVIIDSSYRTVPFILPATGYNDFASYRKEKEDNRFDDGGVTPIPHDAVRQLLECIRDNGHRIAVEAIDPTGLGRRFCLVVRQRQAN